MDAFLARQPILNRDLQLRLHGYELLFRNGSDANRSTPAGIKYSEPAFAEVGGSTSVQR